VLGAVRHVLLVRGVAEGAAALETGEFLTAVKPLKPHFR
jgi:hypothetical protein